VHACLEGKKARGRHFVIGLSHSLDENADEVTVEPRIAASLDHRSASLDIQEALRLQNPSLLPRASEIP
jgi:hypothetical protein